MFTVYTDGPRDSRFVVIIYSGHDVLARYRQKK